MPQNSPVSPDQAGSAAPILKTLKKQMGSVPNLFTNYVNHVAQTEIDFPFVAAQPASNRQLAKEHQTMKIKTTLVAMLFTIIGLSGNAIAADYSHSTPAVQGYDVVTYHTEKRPLRGNGNYVAVHDGATYQFSSNENLEIFNADPERYVPAYNGYCAFGASVGKKFIGDPEVWRVIDGKTYLNLDVGIQNEWLKDVPGRIKTADVTWKKIKNKDPASL
jgi:YHS domain-containing protein